MKKLILGIDEAGRGAWAGPLVVGAVILGDYILEGLTDSKLLSKQLRKRYAELIYENALVANLGWVSPNEIDKIGLTKATKLAIIRALDGTAGIKSEIIIDGNINYLNNDKNSRCLIKADQIIPEVSAASVIAKVSRDEYMKNLSLKFPNYGFDSHVGYGTPAHLKNIKKHGILNIHRKSYKPIMGLINGAA